MAFLIKNARQASTGTNNPGQAVIAQWTHVSRPALALPQSARHQIFLVKGGRILVHALIAEVTTVIEGTDPVSTVEAYRLNDAMDTVIGTTYVVASSLDMSSDEVGTMYGVEGDGTAITSGGQVAGSLEAFGSGFVMDRMSFQRFCPRAVPLTANSPRLVRSNIDTPSQIMVPSSTISGHASPNSACDT